ncbi:hypothetical protein HHK36_012854 [Tetracentron sinense]|uniref:Serine/threonine-protein kinase 19 n=1 Tax=Tetracentron sinense TaxID=13715 RepID=A0A834Z5H9_TETSI|nr:hypothetical protein HHK36_012839 [Tetracentron sinense]KAF8401904.1 hypothetical protein HHK36_012854 [Tetracentron sinense]
MGKIPESRGKKREREEEIEAGSRETDASLSFENSLTFSDTLVALRIMRAQFPDIEKEFFHHLQVSIQPFILRSQLYSSVKDRTQVDRELEVWFFAVENLKIFLNLELITSLAILINGSFFFLQSLKKEKLLRVFKLNTGQDDHAIMFMDDYLNQVGLVMKRMEAKKQDAIAVFEWFKTYVIISKLEPSIEHQELCSLLSFGGKVKDEHISLLINAGLLTRQLIDSNMYWFAIPNIGSVLKGLSQGRKELLSFLNRRKYKEMMLSSLEKKHLRMSPLDMRFHLRDLIGSGHLNTLHTPTGLVVRVCKD